MTDPLASLADWRAASEEARSRRLEAVADELGTDWTGTDEVCGAHELRAFRHPLGVELVAIPGGRFEVGFRDEERDEVARLFGDDSLAFRTIDSVARPVRSVEVRPFLMGREPLTPEQFATLAKGQPYDAFSFAFTGEAGALAATESLGCRLPSEEEWEWVAREMSDRRWVGEVPETIDFKLRKMGFPPNALGVVIGEMEAVADGTVVRGVNAGWQDPTREAIYLHVSVRAALADPACCRPARALT